MNLNTDPTPRERPRKAFGVYREKYAGKIDFRDSLIPSGPVYRRKGLDKSSLFWTILKLIILIPLTLLIFGVVILELLKAYR